MNAKSTTARGAGRSNKNTTTAKATQQEERLDPVFAKAIKKFGDGMIGQLKTIVDAEAARRQKAAA